MQDHHIRNALARAELADSALVGIGSAQSDLSSLLRAGYVDDDKRDRIRATGAVGDLCCQHYSLAGE